jgi:hypothetical protein
VLIMDRHESLSAEVRRKLVETGESTARGLGAALQDHFLVHPRKPCTGACDHGARLDERGQLQTCETCRGLGYLTMDDREIAAAYREIRDRVCEVRAITSKAFDDAVRALVACTPGLTAPGYWLAAARKVETKYQRERAARKTEAKYRW